jgi:hypothetical protein
MNTLSTLRKRKAEDSPHGSQKSKHSKSMLGIKPGDHPSDAPRRAKGTPYQGMVETKHPGSTPGIESGGHPKDAPMEAKDAPLPRHGKRLFIQASLFWQNEYEEVSWEIGKLDGPNILQSLTLGRWDHALMRGGSYARSEGSRREEMKKKESLILGSLLSYHNIVFASAYVRR